MLFAADVLPMGQRICHTTVAHSGARSCMRAHRRHTEINKKSRFTLDRSPFVLMRLPIAPCITRSAGPSGRFWTACASASLGDSDSFAGTRLTASIAACWQKKQQRASGEKREEHAALGGWLVRAPSRALKGCGSRTRTEATSPRRGGRERTSGRWARKKRSMPYTGLALKKRWVTCTCSRHKRLERKPTQQKHCCTSHLHRTTPHASFSAGSPLFSTSVRFSTVTNKIINK